LRLQATKQYTDHVVAMNQQHLQNLERDAEYQRQQAQQVASQQQQAEQQSSSLTADLRASNTELDAVRERIRALEEQESNPSLTLPKTVAPAPATSAAPAPAAQTASTQ
jgi:septal ring factor EnvC (AmiA/AmiB activator)